MTRINTVCVYCGSATGDRPRYTEDAIRFARILAGERIRLVNGGGSIGLMGVMADAILEAGGQCTGVIPVSLKEKEVAHLSMTELIVVPDMHSRKLKMVNLSDAFVAFPGGFGTMDEVFETLTWSQLHLHQKPVLIYNPDGYYDHLIALANHMLAEGFMHAASRALLMTTTDLEEVLPLLRSFTPVHSSKWIQRPPQP